MARTNTNSFRISQNCGGAEMLLHVGPLIPAAWWVSVEDEIQLKTNRMPLPEPIWGRLLVDTGAAGIAIDEAVAGELNLKRAGETIVHGIGGDGSLNRYEARLILPVLTVLGEKMHLAIPMKAWGSPKIRENHDKYDLKAPDGASLRVIGVIGRQFLQFVSLSYDGLNGKFDIFIDQSIQYPKNVE